jgi:hypothetical protein
MALLQKAYLGATPLFRINPWWLPTGGALVEYVAATDATSSASAHTKGSYAQVVASTSADSNFMSFRIQNTSILNTSAGQLLDIAVGPAGNEIVIAPNLAVGGIGGGGNEALIQLPISIPSGSRIAIRNQSEVASQAARVAQFELFNFDATGVPTEVDSLGINTATSAGTKLAGSSGSWTEIVASTTRAYTAICMVPSTAEDVQVNLTNRTLEVGVGSSGNEVSFGAINVSYSANEFVAGRSNVVLFGQDIPAGSRLAVRHDIAANPQKADISLIGIPKV